MLPLFLAAFLCGQASAAPETAMVEPPSWWAGHSMKTIRLLVRGRGMAGARLESPDPGLRAGPARVSASGEYLFADLEIAPRAVPGKRSLRVVSPSGAAEAPFEILAPLDRKTNFKGFSPDDVVYLIMPDRYADGDPANDDPQASRGLHDRENSRYYHGGDLQGIINRLPYLVSLGVTALWLNPVYDNSNRLTTPADGKSFADYHGYGAVDLYAVDEHLGDLAKLRELVEKAHALGLKVIQDQVANHVGPRHPWAGSPPTPTWFNGTPEDHLSNAWQKWTLLTPYASDELRRPTLSGWFLGILPDLNQDDPETARYLIQNSLWWVGAAGFDGIRQDTLGYNPRPFLRDWMKALKAEFPDIKVVGEVFDKDPALVSFYQGGAARRGVDTGVDSLGDFPLMDALLRVFVDGKPALELPALLARDGLYPDPGMLMTQLGSHDEPRFMSRSSATPEGLRLAITFLLSTRGVPMLYAGDELGMRGGPDPDNRRDFPGGWPGDPRDAFTAEGRTPEEQAIHGHAQRLCRLRRELEPLRRGRLVDLAADETAYAYARLLDGQAAVVVFNTSDAARTIRFSAGPLSIAAEAVFQDRLGGPAPLRTSGGRFEAALPPRSAAIYSLHRAGERDR